MPIYLLDDRLIFPDPRLADPSGIIAVGGDLSVDRLVLAYRSGIFPWFNEGESPILWHAPPERFIITPSSFKYGRSIKKLVARHRYRLTFNHAFENVIAQCASVGREGQDGTWIGADMKHAYLALHRRGYAHSAEAFENGELVGGLYGVAVGKVFFGESMFSLQSGVSKIVFATLVPHLFALGYEMIDCQIHTEHLARFGADAVTGDWFLSQVRSLTRGDSLGWPESDS